LGEEKEGLEQKSRRDSHKREKREKTFLPRWSGFREKRQNAMVEETEKKAPYKKEKSARVP